MSDDIEAYGRRFKSWQVIKEPPSMSSEVKWAIFWGTCIAVVTVGEIVAIRSGDDKAPLSHHVRRNTRILGQTPLGRVMLFVGAGWLHRHLYEPFTKEVNKI